MLSSLTDRHPEQRLEDARANEQAADLSRQEKILKLISTELTRNTTRVVEVAVKSEVQNSVLPALENITKNEVKAALNNQISKGLADSMKQVSHVSVSIIFIPHNLDRIFPTKSSVCFCAPMYRTTLLARSRQQ